MRDLLGGKGAGLAEMTRLGLPVPPGFTITTKACNSFSKSGRFPPGLLKQVDEALATVEAKSGKTFGDPANPLLVSVRSGAKFSMPGMMDTVLNLGLNADTVRGLARSTGDERFARDSHRRFIQAFGAERGGRMLDFAHAAADRTFDLIARHRIDCNPTRNGWIQGAFSRLAREDLRRRAEINAQHGSDVEFLDEGRIEALTGSGFHYGGLLERRAGAVHPLKLARGLARAAVGAGASIHETTRAALLEQTGGRWRLSTEQGKLAADRVILATDAYTERLWPRVTQSLVNVTSAQLATGPLPAALLATILPARAGVTETRKITYYYRIDPEGRFVIGGRGPNGDGLDRATVQRIARAAVERFPQLRGTQWDFGWACRVAITMDDLPHVHEVAPGAWTA